MMKKRRARSMQLNLRYIQILCLILFAFLFFGCRAETGANIENAEENHEIHEKKIDDNSNTTPDSEKTSSAGSCANPYYPIDTDTEREYNIEGTAPAKYVLTQRMRDKNGFTETRDFASGLEVVSNWSCSEEGLRNADYNNAISKLNVNVKMETLESSGVSIPKIWKKGKKWTAEYKIRAKLMGKAVDGTVTVDNEIVNMDDNVSVQAGDYVAARVDSVINIKLAMQAAKIPGTKVTMSNWYAPKVGLIKQETKMGSTKSSVELMGEK